MRRADKANLSLIARQLKAHLHCHWVSRGLKNIIKALALRQLQGLFLIAFLLRIDHRVGAQTFGQIQTGIQNIKNHHLLGAENLCPLSGKQADGSAAQDRHITAALIVIAEQAVQGYGRRLEHSGLLIGDGAVVFYRVLFRQHNIFRKASLLPGADKAVVLAQRKVSILAVIAFHTRQKGRSGHGISHLKLGYAFPHLYYIAGKLVAQHNGIEMGSMVKHPRHIGTADSGSPDFHLDRTRRYLRSGIIIISEIFVAIQNCCFHLLFLLIAHHRLQVFIQVPVLPVGFLIDWTVFLGRLMRPANRHSTAYRLLKALVKPRAYAG